MNHRFLASLIAATALTMTACVDDAPVAPTSDHARPSLSVAGGATSYVIDLTGNAVPASLAADITAAGGTITASMDQIGVAVATSRDPGFRAKARKIKGVRSVSPDFVVQWVKPTAPGEEMIAEQSDVTAQSHEIGGHETFRAVQWAPDAISAPAAWATGARGAGARVAILDGGVHSTHIDIAPNLDVARSASFVPGQPFNADVGTFWHGTHVAGIVAAPANDIGTVGIAPEATLIGVKVLHNGSGAFSWIIAGIYYAATPIAEGGAGAHIINMSLGAGFNKNEDGAAELKNALSKATTYAYQRGVTVIAAAGNDGIDIDHTNNLIFVPAMSTHVISVSALGPMGWALGSTDLDRPASYTNFGQSAITLSGPGGDFALPGDDVCVKQRFPVGTVAQFCWAMDMVMAPVRGSGASISRYSWAAGTSMAAPAVSGVAALIIGKNGPMKPSHVETILRQSADDLGKPGNDDYYGRGRVNALRAVQ